MDLPYDLWHLAFAVLMTEKAPPNFEVLSEVRLSIEPQRADILLIRRTDAEELDHLAQILRQLWKHIVNVAVLEFKSPRNYAFKKGDLLRLCIYGMLYDVNHLDELASRRAVTLVLVVASVTPTLREEVARLGAKLEMAKDGYGRIEGLMYSCILVVVDEVCEAERDEYLRLFSHHPWLTGATAEWMKQWLREAKMKGTNVEELPGYEEWFQQLVEAMPIEKRLAGLAPEQVLNLFAPEQVLDLFAPEERLAGLAPEQVVVGLPLEVLRVLPDDYIRTLAPDVQQKIRRRLQEETH